VITGTFCKRLVRGGSELDHFAALVQVPSSEGSGREVGRMTEVSSGEYLNAKRVIRISHMDLPLGRVHHKGSEKSTDLDRVRILALVSAAFSSTEERVQRRSKLETSANTSPDRSGSSCSTG
jgi:hypothetical protein